MTTEQVDLRLPTRTILKVLLTALLVWALLTLWPEIVFFSISLLLAVALEPFVSWLGRKGVSRGLSVILLALVFLVTIASFVWFVLPPLATQIADLIAGFPAFHARVLARLPRDNGALRTVVDQIFMLPSSREITTEVNRPLIWGQVAVSGLMTTFFVLVATLDPLVDGRRLYAWLLAYIPRAHRDKMAETVTAVSEVIYAYVRGQLLTSVLVTLFAASVLSFLGVPAVIPLAILAGVCDVIPVVGIIIATAPAALLALTVSPSAAIAVIVLYVVYHIIESYFIVPRVYGRSLRLSTLAVLLALVVGATLQGLLGAVLVLPLVAAYPIIERIWLKDYFARDLLADHKALAKAAETGSSAAVEAVLQGEKHPGEGRTP